MIEVTALQKNYNGVRGLAGFDLHVEAGELFGLVGPNGAGKSSLIKILATLLPSSGGSARIAGHDVARDPMAIRKVMGYLPDVPGLYSEMRVGEFLEFFADAFHLKGAARKTATEQALERSGLAARREALVEELSFGMKQRLVLAKTLLHGPQVLLLDEPATGLDPLARIELREQLQELQRQGVTILISSHILSDLEDICTRVALIADGRNAAGPDGAAVLDLRRTRAPAQVCEVEFLGDAEAAASAATAFAGAQLAQKSATHLTVHVAGGPEQAGALLRHLVQAGVLVVRFDPHGPDLEDHYREVFGKGGRP